MDLNLRDLVILYVIVKYNQVEFNRLEYNHLPIESWPSAAKAATITTLWNKNDGGLVNRFITNYGILEPVRSAETIYRSLRDKLIPCGMIYPAGFSPSNQYSPTPRGFQTVHDLDSLFGTDPAAWPDKVNMETSGPVDWSRSKRPYLPAALAHSNEA